MFVIVACHYRLVTKSCCIFWRFQMLLLSVNEHFVELEVDFIFQTL